MPSLNLAGYHLTFDDEFGTRSISQTGSGTTWADSRSEWRFDASSDIGFGHSSFVDASSGYDPFSVQGGGLTITAVPDRTSSGYPGSWESGLITTQGNLSQTYGYFEVRADFSAQKGAWDAFWLLPNQQTPNSNNPGSHQELDVVEHYGSNDRGVYSTIHTTDPQGSTPWQVNRQVYSEMAAPSGYHTYGMNWQADTINFYVDGQLVGSQATPSDMHNPMYLLVDLATQGSGGNNADAAGVPITSHIDYVRAYSNDPHTVAVAQGVVSSPDGRDPGLYGATIGADAHSPYADVYSLYEGLLGRAPDAVGAQSWVAALKAGTSLHDIAQAFLNSSEYANHASGLNDTAYVAKLYNQVLSRTGDSAGVHGWTDVLAHGADRSSVANGFLDSSEFQSHYVGQSDNTYVEALYEHALGRQADAGGLQTWTNALSSRSLSRTDLDHVFTSSSEFQVQNAPQSNKAFVDDLYMHALGRAADAGGEQSWLHALSHGATRADVAVAIIESPEAHSYLAPQMDPGWHLA